MTDDSDDPGSIPAEAYPDPVLAFATGDDGPVAAGANEPFRSTFGEVPPETPLREAFADLGLSLPTSDEALAARIECGGRVRVECESTQYLATVVRGDGASAGHVVFTPDRDPGLDRVASVVSHDLRNPLEVAKTRLRVGRETGDEEHFERVARAHDRMERIIEDVLTLARGEEAVDPSESVDLGSVAREAWASVDTADATLTVDDALPTAVVDPDRTGRLFENLFRNAVEHGGEDAAVTVGAADGGFYVADDGPGVPPEEREAVFEPGYSSHDHGTGLGLAIVDRIAAAHGWTVRVDSSAAGGARIEVRGV